MIFSAIALAVLCLVILAFVLEPVLRARGDAVVLDAAALPRPVPDEPDDDESFKIEDEPANDGHRPRSVASPAGIEPRATGEAS